MSPDHTFASGSAPIARERLDVLLVARGLAPSRSRARDLIERGFVSVDGRVADKAGEAVALQARVTLAEGSGVALVSRGGMKLQAALAHFRFDASGLVAIDVGASTGGFTQVLIQAGAARVYAVDVGHGQLSPQLRTDPRVVCLEGTDARRLDRRLVQEAAGAIVADVSFISLTKALGPVLALAGGQAWLVALVKPQFEAGRAAVGKGGIVRDEAARIAAVDTVLRWLASQPGWTVLDAIPSPIAGGDGNQEYLIGATRE
ncbi:MAG: TlyA family RNA methyltransferase [Hyphomicrobiales bacterium]|nr:TlyA family RNA methyltransferase [Hyphomicrobiales bacterium]